MFGYLQPYKEELLVKETRIYTGYYCALCNEIKKSYGRLLTVFLNYESVYIFIFLESLLVNKVKEKKVICCQINPLKTKNVVLNNDIVEYVAFINMLLLDLKLEDDEYDEPRLYKKILHKILCSRKKYKELCKKHEVLLKKLRGQSCILRELENKSGSIDECANTTGVMLEEIISYSCNIDENFECNDEIKKLHFYLGKFIYILDAYEDYEKDVKKQHFNPIVGMGEKEDALEKTKDIILLLMFLIKKNLANIACGINKEIIENITTSGVENAVRRITKEKRKNVHGICIKRK